MALLLAGATLTAFAEEKGKLNEPLEPFRPFLGKPWKGELKEPKAEVKFK